MVMENFGLSPTVEEEHFLLYQTIFISKRFIKGSTKEFDKSVHHFKEIEMIYVIEWMEIAETKKNAKTKTKTR